MEEPVADWGNVQKIFMALAGSIKHEKKTLFPESDQAPSAEVELLVDRWILNQASSPSFSVRPPDELAPWILVRLTCASVLAGLYADGKETPPTNSTETARLIRLLAIDLWHAKMKQIWPNLGRHHWQGDS